MKDTIQNWANLLTIDHAERTVEGYVWEIRALDKWGQGGGQPPGSPQPSPQPPRLTQPNDYTPELINRYVAERRRAVGDAALKRTVNALRAFFGWLRGADSPARHLPLPRVRKRKQPSLDWVQLLAVMSACDTRTYRGIRDLALQSLMVDTGLRASEVCRLTVKNVDLEKRRLVVVVKGGDEKAGKFSVVTASNLHTWLSLRPAVARPECLTLFASIGGLTPGAALTRHGLKAIFDDIGKRAGLERYSPHVLRRTFAKRLILAGTPTRTVQVLGRWENLQQVETYTGTLDLDDLDTAGVDALLPMSQLMNRH